MGDGTSLGLAMDLDDDAEELRELILAELDATKDGWKGKGVEIASNDFDLNKTQRDEVQLVGINYGCHTCGTKIGSDSDQPWIGDHIPPWELSEKVRNAAGTSDTTYLFPQCDECAHQQAFYVRMLNAGIETWELMVKSDKKLIVGGWKPKASNSVRTTKKKVDSAQGLLIQGLGIKLGCHSCGSKVPAKVYISDHVVPQEFCTSYMPKVFEKLKIPYPKSFELRPQCPKCSGYQGGKMKKITDLAVKFAKTHNIAVYK